jgi:pilus assembly protein Flp/PilA
MRRIAPRIQRFLRSDDGPTAVEYAVMIVFIIVVCLIAITSVGTRAAATFGNVAESLPTGGW